MWTDPSDPFPSPENRKVGGSTPPLAKHVREGEVAMRDLGRLEGLPRSGEEPREGVGVSAPPGIRRRRPGHFGEQQPPAALGQGAWSWDAAGDQLGQQQCGAIVGTQVGGSPIGQRHPEDLSAGERSQGPVVDLRPFVPVGHGAHCAWLLSAVRWRRLCRSGRAAEGPAGGRTPGAAESKRAGRSPALLIY